jgi:hypothetical protein
MQEAPKMSLPPLTVLNAAPKSSAYKLGDDKGLYLLVSPSGSKLWQLKYYFHKKVRKLSLGRFPETSLHMARAKRDEARQFIEVGTDPALVRRREKLAAELSINTTFSSIADEYIAKMEAENKSPATLKKARWFRELIEKDIGALPIADILPQELLSALRKIERRGHRETANRTRAFSARVFRYAIVTARATTNPADVLRGALIAPRVKHHAALLEPKEVGELLRAIDGYAGQPETVLALQLSPHLYVRPGELRKAECPRSISKLQSGRYRPTR